MEDLITGILRTLTLLSFAGFGVVSCLWALDKPGARDRRLPPIAVTALSGLSASAAAALLGQWALGSTDLPRLLAGAQGAATLVLLAVVAFLAGFFPDVTSAPERGWRAVVTLMTTAVLGACCAVLLTSGATPTTVVATTALLLAGVLWATAILAVRLAASTPAPAAAYGSPRRAQWMVLTSGGLVILGAVVLTVDETAPTTTWMPSGFVLPVATGLLVLIALTFVVARRGPSTPAPRPSATRGPTVPALPPSPTETVQPPAPADGEPVRRASRATASPQSATARPELPAAMLPRTADARRDALSPSPVPEPPRWFPVRLVSWLTAFAILLLAVPSKLVLAPLGSAGSPAMVFGLVSLVVWFLVRASVARSSTMRMHPIRIAVVAFLVSVGVSYALSMAKPVVSDEVSPADVALLALASWVGTLLVAHDGINDLREMRTLLWRISVLGGLLGTLGVIQVLTGESWVDRISIPGLTGADPAGTFVRGAFVRPSGTAVHPIEYGVVVTMLLPIALHAAMYLRDRRPVVRWLPAAALVAVVPLTSSRSAYVGAAIGLAVYFLGWSAQRRVRMLGVGVLGMGVMVISTPGLLGSIVGLFSGLDNDPSISSRTDSYDFAGQFLSTNPLFGRGLGTFLPRYRIFDNEYLVLLVSVGVVGTVLFLTLWLVAASVLIRVRRRVADESTRDLAVALTASITVGFVSLFFFDAFAFPMTMGILFLLLGMAGALRRVVRAHPTTVESQPTHVLSTHAT